MLFKRIVVDIIGCNFFKNITRCAHIIVDGRGSCSEHFDLNYQCNFENHEFGVPLSKFNRLNMKEYKFPTFRLKYTRKDSVDHALSGKFKIIC